MSRKPIADPFTVDEIHFRTCFTAPSLKQFATIYRFLARAQWELDSVSCKALALLVQTFASEDGEVLLVVDDTLNKRCGEKICGAAWRHDGAAPKHSKRFSYGVCFVIIGMAVRLPGIAERTFCLPFAARMWWPDSAKVKPEGIPRRTKPQLGLELVTLAWRWIDDSHTIRVVGNIGYSCETLVKGRPKGVHLTGRVCMD